MKILTFTSLFPNREQPNSAIFIKKRMAAVNLRSGVEVRVVAPVPYYPPLPVGGRWKVFSKIPARESLDALDVWHPRYLVSPKVGMTSYGCTMFLGSVATVARIFREWRFDVIDAHYVYPDAFAALLLAKLFRRPLMVSARGTDINLYPQFRLIRPLIKSVISGADQLISVCGSLADIMADLGADPGRITVVPNGIDPSSFPAVDRVAARIRIGMGAHRRLLLTVGSLTDRKGMHLLVDALALLQGRGELDFFTCIVGSGPERERLQRMIAEKQLSEAVRLVGEISNACLGDWYHGADLFFLGSSREGWPNVVSEALACGTPVVATSVNGIPEILTSSDLGTIVDRDAGKFAEAIKAGLSRAWDSDLIRAHGQRRTWDLVAEEVLAVADRVVSGRSSCRRWLDV